MLFTSPASFYNLMADLLISQHFPVPILMFISPHSVTASGYVQEDSGGLRPRLCYMRKETGGFGFNLHSEKTKPVQFIRAVEEGSPAQRAGLRAQDRIIQVSNTHSVSSETQTTHLFPLN